MSGGKGGGGQKVHEIHVGAESVLAMGSIDKVTEIRVDDKTAWRGEHLGGRLWVAARNLFGGHDREGGIEGVFDFRLGKANQGRSDYLAKHRGGDIPARRGLTTLVLEGIYIGLNPYMKKMKYKIQSVANGLAPEESQWYPEKAAIPLPDFNFDDTIEWDMSKLSGGSSFGNDWKQEFSVDKTRWLRCTGDLCHAYQGNYGSSYASQGVDLSGVSEIRFSVLAKNYSEGYPVPIGTIHVGGNAITLFGGAATFPNIAQRRESAYSIIIQKISASSWTLSVHDFSGKLAEKTLNSMGNGISIYTRLGRSDSMSNPPACGSPFVDILISPVKLIKAGSEFTYNPAHALHEIHTSRRMMGKPLNEIDDASFKTAADRLYTEGFGISPFAFTRRDMDSLIDDICTTAGAKVFQDPNDGLYKIKLIRYDYNPDTLPVLDERHIGDLKNVKRQKLGEVPSHLTLKYNDHEKADKASVIAINSSLERMQGGRITDEVDYPFIVDRKLASRVVERDARALAARPMAAESVNVRPPVPIAPGDVVKIDLSNAKHNKQIKGIFRVEKLEEGSETDTALTLKVVEDVFSLLPDSYLTTVQVPGWERPNSEPVPAAGYAAEAPYYEIAQHLGDEAAQKLTATDSYVYALAQRPNPQMYAVKMATNRTGEFEQVDAFDFTATFAPNVDISISATSIVAPIDEPAMLRNLPLGSHLLITEGAKFEHVIFDGYDSGTSTLTVKRGALDTVPQAFTKAAKIWSSDMFYGFDESKYIVGSSVIVKVLPQSTFGTLEHPFAEPLTVNVTGRQSAPYPAANVQYNGQPFHVDHELKQGALITWTHRNRLLQTATLTDFYAGSITPEAGVTYQMVVTAYQGTTSLGECYNQNLGTATSHTIDLNNWPFDWSKATDLIVQIWAVRDNIKSIQAAELKINIKTGYGKFYGVKYGG